VLPNGNFRTADVGKGELQDRGGGEHGAVVVGGHPDVPPGRRGLDLPGIEHDLFDVFQELIQLGLGYGDLAGIPGRDCLLPWRGRPHLHQCRSPGHAHPAAWLVDGAVLRPPATWPDPTEASMVDLDLDVWRTRPNGAVELLDQDEFAAHHRQYSYPAEVVSRAEAMADWLQSAVANRVEPFGGVHQHWLDGI
jgi:hypothetical protein